MRLLMGFVCLWGTLFAGLQERIEGVIAERDPTALVGIEVYAVRKGKVIYAQNSERRFLPGSCLKVISGLAALDQLGEDFCFETKLVSVGNKGFLVGSGDPSFGFADLEELVLQFKGDELLIDSDVFEGPVMGPGWMWDEEPAYWCVPMNGLNLEHNFIEGRVVERPEVLAAVIAGGLMERRGMKVRVGLGKAPQNGEVIAVHRSEPLGELLKVSLKDSDNLYPECIFRKLGGSWEKSAEVVKGFLKERIGLDPEQLRIVDGSGLSRYNLITPHQMVEVLKGRQGSRVFREALSVAGVDGTLRNRMRELYVSGKTGSMTGVSCLCGYLMTEKAGELIFAIFMNNYVKEGREIRAMADEICRLLSTEVL